MSKIRKSALFLFALFLAFSTSAQNPSQSPRTQSCRSQPTLIGKCFKVRGRLSLYNGAPTVRLWRAGTKRMLGVSASYSREGYSRIPGNVEKLLNWENEVWGDYLVCPFTKQRRGEMQMICIDKGENLSVRTRH